MSNCALVDLRALLRVGVERVAQLAGGVEVDQLFDELVVNLFLHEQTTAGTAALALVEIEGVVRADGRRVEVGVGEDDVGAFAAQLEGQPFEGFGRVPHDDLGRLVFAGEGHLVDARVFDDRGTGGGAVAGYDVDHAVGDAGLLGQPGHP